jgi:trehalose 6-phosphate phosphatase
VTRLEDLELTAQDALYLDFDGVLAEIGPDPDAVRLNTSTAEDLSRLSTALGGAVVLLSGRDVRDLASRTTPQVWRAGGHGLETIAPNEIPPPTPPGPPTTILDALDEVLQTPGVRLELKGPVAALHFRAAPDM